MQEDEGFFGGLTDERAVFGDGSGDFRLGGVGIFEEAEGEFYAEDAAHGFVDCGHGDAAGFDEAGEFGVVEVRHHVDIDAGVEGFFCGGGGIEGDAVVEKLHDGGVVADDESVEAPFLAEDGGEQVGVGGAGNSVEGVEGAHDGGGAGFDCGFVGREIDLAEAALAHVGGVVFATGFYGSVGGEVFNGGSYAVGFIEGVGLIAADVGARHGGAEVRVFARAFGGASPAGVAGDVDHGGVEPADARGGGFFGGHAGELGDELWIEAGGEA